MGTVGRRCTSVRRLLVDELVHAEFVRLQSACASVRIGNPLDDGTWSGR